MCGSKRKQKKQKKIHSVRKAATRHRHNVALGDSFGARFAAFGGIHAPLTARFAIALVDWRCTSTFGDCIKAISG